MAKYNWDLSLIKNNITLLAKMLERDIGDVQRIIITDTISQYHNMLSMIANRCKFDNIGDDIDEDVTLDALMKEFMRYLTVNDKELIN